MFAIAYDHTRARIDSSILDGRRQELADFLASRKRVMESRDILYCSPAIRAMIEDDIPNLISVLLKEG